MDQKEFHKQLIHRYVTGEATEKELEAFFALMESGEMDEELQDYLQVEAGKVYAVDTTAKRRWLPRISVAASIIALLSAGGIYYFSLNGKPQQVAVSSEEIAPVQKGVYLTLGNGQKVRLGQQNLGSIKNSDGTLTDQKQDELVYGKGESNPEPVMHTLTNNSSTKYSLVLADGSEAFLDMASSISYPVAFTGKDRKVSITGQVFFKVKHNAKQPFSVTAGEQTIEDIGTEFNVDAYHRVVTTLIQGAVRVHEQDQTLDLVPGKAAFVENDKLTIADADVEMATIWLQGKIALDARNLEEVLKEVGRIYDVQFVWTDASLKQLQFGGAVSRTQKLSKVLDFFRKTGKVDFTVEGKTVTVIKKKKTSLTLNN